MDIKDNLMQISYEDESSFLRSILFPVSIRLLHSNREYAQLIQTSILYMVKMGTKTYDNYPTIRGISGANCGIPYNIVVIWVKWEKEKIKLSQEIVDEFEYDFKGNPCIVMLNPNIISFSLKTFTTLSNCGSLCLKTPISVVRHEWIEVEYYTITGEKRKNIFRRPICGTLQHEIEHNLGILIIDK